MHFAAVDVGSPAKGNLGWWVVGPDSDYGGTDPDELIRALVTALEVGPLILGFEAPMYVPAKRIARNILRKRPDEGSRSWSGAAGATTTAIALAVVPWVLDEIGKALPNVRAWQDWNTPPRHAQELVLFEAFVSGGPSDGHAADARAAAVAARQAHALGAEHRSALDEEPCFSLLGAALLHAGLSADLSELRRSCMVIRAAKVLSNPPKALQ